MTLRQITCSFLVVLLLALAISAGRIFLLPQLVATFKEGLVLFLATLVACAAFLANLGGTAEKLGRLKIRNVTRESADKCLRETDPRSAERARAFLLGWDSTMVLITKLSSRRKLFISINRYLAEFGIELPDSPERYLCSPEQDEGLHAQAFKELVNTCLVGAGKEDEAAYFRLPHNLALVLAPHLRGRLPGHKRNQITTMIEPLPIASRLKVVPRRNALGWMNRLHRYFEAAYGS